MNTFENIKPCGKIPLAKNTNYFNKVKSSKVLNFLTIKLEKTLYCLSFG
jgi:hypothetical protein